MESEKYSIYVSLLDCFKLAVLGFSYVLLVSALLQVTLWIMTDYLKPGFQLLNWVKCLLVILSLRYLVTITELLNWNPLSLSLPLPPSLPFFILKGFLIGNKLKGVNQSVYSYRKSFQWVINEVRS